MNELINYLRVTKDGGRDAVHHVGVDVAAVLHVEDLLPFFLGEILRAVGPSPGLGRNTTRRRRNKKSQEKSRKIKREKGI